MLPHLLHLVPLPAIVAAAIADALMSLRRGKRRFRLRLGRHHPHHTR
jgi:hypothetical protein